MLAVIDTGSRQMKMHPSPEKSTTFIGGEAQKDNHKNFQRIFFPGKGNNCKPKENLSFSARARSLLTVLALLVTLLMFHFEKTLSQDSINTALSREDGIVVCYESLLTRQGSKYNTKVRGRKLKSCAKMKN